jgi:hypothetical protein
MISSTRSNPLAPLVLALLALAAYAPPATADDVGGGAVGGVVGHVATLAGEAAAERPGAPPRPLRCTDPVHAGERVVTPEGGRVGVLVGDVLAQLGEKSAVRVDETSGGTADLTLEQGAVRVIDPRDAGAEARLAALDARAAVLGNDAEAYVFAEKAGPYAMLCEWDQPLTVARADESAVAQAGRCVVAKRREPLYLADAHAERLGAPAVDACARDSVIGGIDLHLSPTDVAAGPLLGPWSGPGTPLTLPPRSPCDDPGAGCATIIEPPPTGGGIGGGGGTFPGP